MGRTLFIFGAGVSSPYGYPDGKRLIEAIKEKLEGKSKYNQEQAFYDDLVDGGSYSIDSFLRDRPEYASIGKALIAEILSELEDPDQFNRVDFKLDFYRFLFDHYRNENFKDFDVITFNYDRSFEFYFARAIKAATGCAEVEAFNQLYSKTKIVHMHGRLGLLPSEPIQPGVGNERTSYGALSERLSVFSGPRVTIIGNQRTNYDEARDKVLRPTWDEGIQNFRTPYENHQANEDAKALISNANRIFFLGYSYQDLNMKALGFDFSLNCYEIKIVGTCMHLGGIPMRRIEARYPAINKLFPVTCVGLFEEYVSLTDPTLDWNHR